MIKKLNEGEADLRQALKLDPAVGDSAYPSLLGIATAREDWKTELTVCKEWVDAMPKSWLACSELASRLLGSNDTSLRDHEQALPLAKKASDLTEHKNPDVEDLLAAAYFGNNETLKAIEAEKNAISLQDKLGVAGNREQFSQHLAQYEFAKPPDP